MNRSFSFWDAFWAAVLLASAAWFLSTRLAFCPVPWPDGSAFYLPALDLLKPGSPWRMHAQAAFVPTYDQVNFNLMPGLPVFLALFQKLGVIPLFGAPLGIKVVSFVPWALWGWVLYRFARKHLPLWAALGISLAAVLDPTIRWATSVVRTEAWIGLFWLLIFVRLRDHARATGPRELSRARWAVSLWLALAAYFHFEAVYLVPATAVGLWRKGSARETLESLLGVGWRTALLLSPWIAYALAHWSVLWAQMDVQFHRLSHYNPWAANLYLVFHGLFLSLGSAEDWPKFFNVGKALFCVLMLATSLYSVMLVGRRRPDLLLREGEPPAWIASGIAAFATSAYLWLTKPEIWFISILHWVFWPWLAAVWVASARRRAGMAGICYAFAALCFLATVGQQVKTGPGYSWPTYSRWVDCIEREIRTSSGGAAARVWQPHIPDVLVELSQREPAMDLTRALDFPDKREVAWAFGRDSADAIVFTRHVSVWAKPGAPADYEGPERESDRALLDQELEIPFGPRAVHDLPRERPGAFEMRICESGPFWADVAVRRKGAAKPL